MPAAARSGGTPAGDVRDTQEGRVPCPQCGGLIHPIAGKCKHCKADLTQYRAARPAANTPLPALGQASVAQPTVLGNGHPPHAPVAHAVPLPAAAQTVLPARPTGRAQTEQLRGSMWRSWPVVVIVVAMFAIVAAVVIMVWPTGRGREGTRALQPPPAPERMDTQTPPVTPKIDSPTPHATAPRAAPTAPITPAPDDPWAPRAQSADPPADPGAQNGDAQSPGAQSDPSADDDSIDALPPVRRAPLQRGRRRLPPLYGGGIVELAMIAQVCRKMIQCGTADPGPTCAQITRMPVNPPPSCPAAERCLRQIDAMGCAQPDAFQLGMLVMRFRDCAEAERC